MAMNLRPKPESVERLRDQVDEEQQAKTPDAVEDVDATGAGEVKPLGET
jgi:hypothetical protein